MNLPVKDKVKLIVGLGNPGTQYDATRHNAGAKCLETFTRMHNIALKPEKKFYGHVGKGVIGHQSLWCLLPTTYMNCSGKAVAALANFYRIEPCNILVIQDELDLPPGCAKFKQGGGHGGQNGLKDIIQALGNCRDFYRLRIGIGHPGDKSKVTQYVLSQASRADDQLMEGAMDAAIHSLPQAIQGDWVQAMNQLHSYKAETPL